MAAEYVRFHWLDVKKIFHKPEEVLSDLGLSAFPHLIGIAKISLVAIMEPERKRQAVNNAPGPFLGEGVMDRAKLTDITTAITLAEQSTKNSVIDVLIEAAISNESPDLLSLPINNVLELIQNDAKLGKTKKEVAFNAPSLNDCPFKLDQFDYFALKVIQNLDFAYEDFQARELDSALQSYSTAKFFYDHLRHLVLTPGLTPLALGEAIGRKKANSGRSAAGGDKTRDKYLKVDYGPLEPLIIELLKEIRRDPRRSLTITAAVHKKLGELNDILTDTKSPDKHRRPPGYKHGAVPEKHFKVILKKLMVRYPELFPLSEKAAQKQRSQ